METITTEEISNCELAAEARPGDIVSKHRYEGGQVDWCKLIEDGLALVWYGGPGPIVLSIDDVEFICGDRKVV